MKEWKEHNLQDLVFIDKDQLNSSTESNFSFYYIDISSVSTDNIKLPETPILFKDSPSRARKILHDGDILMSTVRPNLKAFAKFKKSTDRSYIASTGFVILSKKENANIDFVYHCLFSNELDEQIETLVVGSNYPALNTSDIRKLKIFTPTLKIQNKISKILTSLNSLISKTQAAISKYKAIKQGMLQDLFTRGIDIKTGKLRPKYEDAPELYKESKLGMVPKEWEDSKMGKYILENLYGPRFNAKDYSETGNVKTIRGTDFTKTGEILYNQAPKALLSNVLINNHKLETGDVVIVTTADCGLTAVFKKPINDVDFIPSAYSVKYRFSKYVNPYFVKYFMATDNAIRQVNKFVRQGTLGNLPGSDILNFNAFYPEPEEQNHITERLLSIDKKIESEQTYLQKLNQLKSGLMSDLLSGKKLVNVEEPILSETEN